MFIRNRVFDCLLFGQAVLAFSKFSFQTRPQKKKSGQQARWRCQVGGRHLPTVSYGQSYQQPSSVTGFIESTVFAHLDRLVSRHILSGSLTGNSCSAALTCVFVLREEFAFLFQTFSRSDPLRQRFRGAEGESSPQSPPAGAFLLKKRKRKNIF